MMYYLFPTLWFLSLLTPHHIYAQSTCTVHAKGNGADDAPSILSAIKNCGRGGTIILPSSNYTIAQPITTHLDRASLHIHGYLSFTTDIDYWVANSYRFPFQNQSIAWHITGNDFVVDAHNIGGVFGNGQVWYSWAKGVGNLFGRPISVSVTNATRGVVRNFRIIQPQFWASLVWNSSDILLSNFYINATNTDPAAGTSNWLQNTDGSDSYQSKSITYQNWIYQGGDDCIAFKPNSTQIVVRNVSCFNGGIAFGSIGQYSGKFDILQDILVEDVVAQSSEHTQIGSGTYFKSWIGVSIGTPPNGGGGGSGYCKNVTIRNIHIINGTTPLSLTSNLSYSQLNQSYANTSTFQWSDIHFSNITGSSKTDAIVNFECSSKAPCTGWTFEGINIKPANKDNSSENFVCTNFEDSKGLECHA